MTRKRQSNSESSTESKPATPPEKSKRRTYNKVPKVQEAYLVRYELVDSSGFRVSEHDKMESMGEMMQQVSSEKEETPAPTSSQCIISVIDLPYQKTTLTPMEAEIRYVPKLDDFHGREQQKAEKFQKNDKKSPAQTIQEQILSTSIPSVPQNTEEDLDVIEILYPPNTQQQKPQPPNLSQLQRLLIAVSSKNISIRPQDFDALELLVGHNEMLIRERLEQSPTRSLGRQKKKVEHHVNLHKQKIQKVKDLLSKVHGFSEKMTVDLYYAFHELHVESKMYNPNDLDMFYNWIKNNIDLYFELDRLNERFLSGKEKESALRMERHQTISYYREKLGISGDQVGIIQNKLCLEAKNALYGQVPLKQREYLVEEGLQNAQNNQGIAQSLHIDPLTHLRPENPSFQNYINANSLSSIPLTHLNVALPPEIQLALGLNTFQIPTPPSTSSTLSPVVANGIPYSGSRASSPPSAFSAFTPIGAAAANILSPISTAAGQLLPVDEPQVVKPIIPESLNQFDLLAEQEKLNKQNQILTQRLNDLSLEDGVIHRMNKELSKDRLELKDLYNTEIELRKQIDVVRAKKRQVDFRLTENEKLKEEKVRKVKRAKEEVEQEREVYNKNVEDFNKLVKLSNSLPTWSGLDTTLIEPVKVPVFDTPSTISPVVPCSTSTPSLTYPGIFPVSVSTPSILSNSTLNTMATTCSSSFSFSPLNNTSLLFPPVSAPLTTLTAELMALVSSVTQLSEKSSSAFLTLQ